MLTNEEKIGTILRECGVREYAFLPFSSASKANERLWNECNGEMNTCIMLLFPYKTDYTVEDNYVFSAYARTRDYHRRTKEFFDIAIPKLEKLLGHKFKGYADHSPIGEKSAAAKCGLGVLGKNTLLINKRYGSYIFIASILTDMILKSDECEPAYCMNCGKCKNACPGKAIGDDSYDYEKCLSYISQKKVKTPEEWKILAEYNVIWGCDICQDVCPMNGNVEASKDEYFAKHVITDATEELIASMDENTFSEFPFSWRKKDIIIQNFKNCSAVID